MRRSARLRVTLEAFRSSTPSTAPMPIYRRRQSEIFSLYFRIYSNECLSRGAGMVSAPSDMELLIIIRKNTSGFRDRDGVLSYAFHWLSGLAAFMHYQCAWSSLTFRANVSKSGFRRRRRSWLIRQECFCALYASHCLIDRFSLLNFTVGWRREKALEERGGGRNSSVWEENCARM